MSLVEIGVALAAGSPVVAGARRAEAVGLDSVSVSDLLLGDGTPALECVVAAAAIAAATGRVRVQLGVLVLPLRHIAVLGAQISALQQVSGNRIVLGVGAGGFPGSPFARAVGGPARDRGRRLETMIEVLRPLIAGEPATVAGELSRPTVTLAPPVPVPPVLVGGHSDAAVRRAVTHGDGWYPSLMSPATLARRVRVLHEIAAAHGRPRPVVHFGTHAALGADGAAQREALAGHLVRNFGLSPEEAAAVPITGSPRQVADRLAEYAAAGADGITVALDGENPLAQLDRLAEARALLRADTPVGAGAGNGRGPQ